MKKGAFITLYGINNIGKSTHAKLLLKYLKNRGIKAIYLKFPNYDIKPTGPKINKTLRSPEGQKISEDELQLWFVLNRYQTLPQIKKLLRENYIVLAEDYTGTGIAWGIAKGLKEDWLVSANNNLIKEDLAILIDGKRNMSAKEKNHVHEQNDILAEKCRKVHLNLAKKFGWRIVNLRKEKKDTFAAIREVVDEFLAGRYY